MRTTNGFKYSIKKSILTLEIPKDMGVYSKCVQDAKIELCLNEQIYFTEIKTIKAAIPDYGDNY